jgi:hypothetical protein
MSLARYLTAILFAIDRRAPAVRLVIVCALFLGVFVADYSPGRRIPFLQKPFTPASLSRKVREVVDAS